jgi:hypothetical protein
MALEAMMPYGDLVLRLYAKALYCKGKKVVTDSSNFVSPLPGAVGDTPEGAVGFRFHGIAFFFIVAG